MVMKLIKRTLFIALCAVITACASVPSTQLSGKEIEAQFEVPEGKSVIYLYRKITFAGSALLVPVSLNGISKGNMGYKTYFRWEVNPGKYNISAHMAEGAEIVIHLEKGNNYFVQAGTTFSFIQPGAELIQVDEARGLAAVRVSSLLLGN